MAITCDRRLICDDCGISRNSKIVVPSLSQPVSVQKLDELLSSIYRLRA